MIDEGPYSRNTTVGEDTYFQFSLHNYQKQADKVYLRGSVTYHADKVGKGYEMLCMGSNDGENWEELGRLSGKGLPGKASRYTMHSDPNKQSEKGDLPVRILDNTFRLPSRCIQLLPHCIAYAGCCLLDCKRLEFLQC